jgi:16S rRNA G527 N7-methylase RsmG
MTDDTRLLTALAVIQARGAIGERSLVGAVAHADRFVDLIPATARSGVDLGSGGGLPGLVIAWRCPQLVLTMVERRATRADLLRRATISLGLADRTRVLDVDVAKVCDDSPHGFDLVTSRSFGDVRTTAGFIAGLLCEGGVALVSEPPVDRTDEWTAVLADHPHIVDTGVHQGIRRLVHI